MHKIIHIDMDCFYAAVEMREHPELVGKPIAVGGGSPRSVVSTCNYEARKYGVHSAMPGFMAKEKCPRIVFLPCRFELYREASCQIRKIFYEYTPLVEPLSLDEAYLDVSHSKRYAWDIAKEIRGRIFNEMKLTASAGIAGNKMLAKIASDWRKPNGQFAILPEQVAEFMTTLPVRKIWGVGPKSAEHFAKNGIHTCTDLQKFSIEEMTEQHGKWGEELYRLCRGIDEREVEPHRTRKSLSNENTFNNNLVTLDECREGIHNLSLSLIDDLHRYSSDKKVIKAFIKIKFNDFTQTTKECLCSAPAPEVFQTLLTEAYLRKALPVRLLGTGVRFDVKDETSVAEIDAGKKNRTIKEDNAQQNFFHLLGV